MTTLGILSRPRSAAAAPNSALSGGGGVVVVVRPPPLKQEGKSAKERKTRRARKGKALLALCSFALRRSSPVGRRKAEREERDGAAREETERKKRDRGAEDDVDPVALEAKHGAIRGRRHMCLVRAPG